jgi:hypothetical protein
VGPDETQASNLPFVAEPFQDGASSAVFKYFRPYVDVRSDIDRRLREGESEFVVAFSPAGPAKVGVCFRDIPHRGTARGPGDAARLARSLVAPLPWFGDQ